MPVGTKFDDGFSTQLRFGGGASDVAFWEVEIAPPGGSVDGNANTSMTSEVWESQLPKTYKKLMDLTGTCSYGLDTYGTVMAQLGVNQWLKVIFPDDSAMYFRGWLADWKPNAHKEGERATAAYTIKPSNVNDDGSETGPFFLEPPPAPTVTITPPVPEAPDVPAPPIITTGRSFKFFKQRNSLYLTALV